MPACSASLCVYMCVCVSVYEHDFRYLYLKVSWPDDQPRTPVCYKSICLSMSPCLAVVSLPLRMSLDLLVSVFCWTERPTLTFLAGLSGNMRVVLCLSAQHVSVFLCVFMSSCVSLCICMYVCIYLCMYVCTYVCTYVCMYETDQISTHPPTSSSLGGSRYTAWWRPHSQAAAVWRTICWLPPTA